MGLFSNLEDKEEEKAPLFSTENTLESGDKKDGSFGESGETGHGDSGGNGDSGHGDTGESADRDSGGFGGGDNGGIGAIQLSFDDSEVRGENGITGNGNDDFGGTTTSTDRNGTSNEEKSISKKPSWLNFGSKETVTPDEEKVKDIKIKRQYNKRRNKGGMEEEQVEILFSSLFDGLALFKGSHWKLQEEEKHIIPSLTRIINRMLEALPKGFSDNAFNVMDYVIVFGSIGAMILSRLQADKGAKEIGKQGNGNTGSSADGISTKPEIVTGGDFTESIQPSRTVEGIENGISSLPPIKDIANAITRIH